MGLNSGGLRPGGLRNATDGLSPSNAIPDSVVSRPDDGSVTSSITKTYGFIIEVSSDWPSIGARLSLNTVGPTRAYLNDSNGNGITSVDISGLSANDAFTFDNVNLVSGNQYQILIDAQGSNWDGGFYGGSTSYPYTSSDVDIKNRYNGGSIDTGSPVGINDIGDVGNFSGGGGATTTDIDLFLVSGQSNARGKGDESLSPNPDSGTVLEYENATGSINNPLVDPMDFDLSTASTGSAWPAFGIEYYNRTGRPSAYVGYAEGGTAQHTDASAGSGTWDTDGNLRSNASQAAQNAINDLESAGYDVTFRGVLWHQGERDAKALDSGSITASQYKTALENMIDGFRSDLSRPNMDFWLFQIGVEKSGSYDTAYSTIRTKQSEVTSNKSNVYMASDIQKNFDDGRMVDDDHYNQDGLNDMGHEGAITVSNNI